MNPVSDKKSAIVVDIETKKSLQELGPRDNKHLLGVSVAGVYDYLEDKCYALEEHELSKLENLFKAREVAIGFNVESFDWPVLQPYFNNVDLTKIDTIDLMRHVELALGFRLPLNNLAKHTLGEEKGGHSLQAIDWFREGKIEKIKKYCLGDVKITKDLYEYGLNHGVVRYDSRVHGVTTIPAGWALGEENTKDIKRILKEARDDKQLVEIDYISASVQKGEIARKKRNIEVHSISGTTVEAYCHLRGAIRNFKLWRMVSAKPLDGGRLRPTLF